MDIGEALSTGLQIYGTLSEGQQAKEAGDYNADVARSNAAYALFESTANAAAQQRQSRQVIGEARAAYGASGVTVEGSPIDILEQSAKMAEIDRQNILYAGNLRSKGYSKTANLETSSGKNAQNAGYLKAGVELLASYFSS